MSETGAAVWSLTKIAVGAVAVLVFLYAGLAWLRERDAMVVAVTVAVGALAAFAAFAVVRSVWRLLRN